MNVNTGLLRFFSTKCAGAVEQINWMVRPPWVDTAVWMHQLDANKTAGEEARRQLYKNVESHIE